MFCAPPFSIFHPSPAVLPSVCGCFLCCTKFFPQSLTLHALFEGFKGDILKCSFHHYGKEPVIMKLPT
nr:hypothetical protein [bacterium]